MSLSSAITTAQTIFSNTGKQTAVVSQNIANVGNADYSRRMAMMGVDSDGRPYIDVQRAQNDALQKRNITSLSDASAQSRLLSGLQQIQSAFGGADYPTSPASYLTSFRSSLQTYAASPGSITIATTAVAEAKDVAGSLRSASKIIDDVTAAANKEVAEQVDQLNQYLGEFEKANNAVIGALANNRDAGDAFDKRDALLKSIAEIVGISTTTRPSMDMVIFANDGSVLFENTARKVTLQPRANELAPDYVQLDGVELAAGAGGNTSAQGTLAALFQIRDDIAPKMQQQLDEIARGLIEVFKESDQPDELQSLPGLFVGGVDDGLPAPGVIVPGLARRIAVNSAVDENPLLLRDGGFNNASGSTDFTYNKDGVASFTSRIDQFVTGMAADIDFDPTADIDSNTDIMSYAASSIGWIEQIRKAANSANETKSATLAQTQQTLSNETGVSLDEELSLMLDLEQSYKASAKLLSTVDEMLTSLLDMVR